MRGHADAAAVRFAYGSEDTAKLKALLGHGTVACAVGCRPP
ncbi:hypothetical protein AB0I98_15390 [Streptomyces sp. NPDC050211]